jgi:hypothetical protein
VVDRPVTAVLPGDADYNDLFKWAEHFNNYHPEVMNTVHSKMPLGYTRFIIKLRLMTNAQNL